MDIERTDFGEDDRAVFDAEVARGIVACARKSEGAAAELDDFRIGRPGDGVGDFEIIRAVESDVRGVGEGELEAAANVARGAAVTDEEGAALEVGG